jgi:thioredoxin-related protein
VTGREPSKNQYYSSKVTWLLVVLVGVALMVVGVMVTSDRPEGIVPPRDEDTTSAVKPADPIESSQSVETDTILSDLIEWQFFDQGMAALKDTILFAMIYFTSDDCEPCRKMENETFSSEDLLSAMHDLIIPIKIESNSSRKMTYSGRLISESRAADFFDIPGYPALLFYDSREDHYLFIQPGFVNTSKLVAIFDYLQDRVFKDRSITLDQYLKSKNID